jgi:hypothetical protein
MLQEQRTVYSNSVRCSVEHTRTVLPCLLPRPYIWLHTVDRMWALGPTQPPVKWVPGLSRG